MNRALQQQALELSQRIVEEWFAGNNQPFCSYLGEGVSWIGSVESQFYVGREQVLNGVERASAPIIPCTLSEQIFFIADSGRDYCLCVGRYICTLDRQGMFMSEPQRITFLWKQEEKEIRITHLHLSNTMAAVAPDEEFPVQASRHNYEYVQKKLKGHEELVSFVTTDATKIMLNKQEVQYVEADNDYVLIYTNKRERYRVHTVFGRFVEKNFSDYLKIHRSIVINPQFLSQVKGGKAILENGVALPISRTRYKEMRKRFGDI